MKYSRKHFSFQIMMLTGCLFFCACLGCAYGQNNAGEPYFAEENQVKNVDGDISAFGLNIAPAVEIGDRVLQWVSEAADGEGFGYYLCADPDSWDVYLYYPKEQAGIRALTNDDVAVDFSDGVLWVYVTPASVRDADDGQVWLLHLAAAPFGAWPSEVALFWDGREIARDEQNIKISQ